MSAIAFTSRSAPASDTAPRQSRVRVFRRRLATFVTTLVIMAAVSVGVAAPSQAASTYCSNGQCTTYLNWSETVNLSNGRPPRIVTPVPQLTAAINAGLWGHVLIAKGWVWRGNCVAFTANVRPWATQGMTGWRCR